MWKNLGLIILLGNFLLACTYQKSNSQTIEEEKKNMKKENLEIATLGGGCFWCLEAVYQKIEGVEAVVSGYAGGHKENPSYKEVCAETTGHAEVVQVHFDPKVISYEEILDIFWRTHNPTTLNRQGNDVGTQYRSAIFYHSENQKKLAENSKTTTEQAGYWEGKFVTEITPFSKFYEAEDYHQNYYANNPSQGYCTYVIAPKLEKVEKDFKERLKVAK